MLDGVRAGQNWMTPGQDHDGGQGQYGEHMLPSHMRSPASSMQFAHHGSPSMGHSPFDPNPQPGDGRGLDGMGPGDGSHNQISSQGQLSLPAACLMHQSNIPAIVPDVVHG